MLRHRCSSSREARHTPTIIKDAGRNRLIASCVHISALPPAVSLSPPGAPAHMTTRSSRPRAKGMNMATNARYGDSAAAWNFQHASIAMPWLLAAIWTLNISAIREWNTPRQRACRVFSSGRLRAHITRELLFRKKKVLKHGAISRSKNRLALMPLPIFLGRYFLMLVVATIPRFFAAFLRGLRITSPYNMRRFRLGRATLKYNTTRAVDALNFRP